MPSEYAPVYEKIMTDLQARADSNAHLLEVLKKVVSGLLPPGARVVDVGCGPGEPAASYLAGLGHKVTGLDFAQNVVDQAREKVPEAEFIKVDFREWEPPPGVEYDLVLVSHALYNFPLAQLRSLAFTFASWANAGGLVVVGQSIKCEAVEENTLPFDEDGWAEGVPNLFLGHVFRSTYAMADTWRRLFESTGLEFVSLDERICVRPGAPDKRNLASFITLRKTGKNPFFGPYPVLKSLPEPLPVGESNRGGWEEVLKRQKKGADTIEESVFEKVLYLGVGGGDDTFTSLPSTIPDPNGSYDVVVAGWTLLFTSSLETTIKEIVRVLSPTGPARVVLVEGAPDNEWVNLMNKALLAQSKTPVHHGILLEKADGILKEAGLTRTSLTRRDCWLNFADLEEKDRVGKATEILASITSTGEDVAEKVRAVLVDKLTKQFGGRPDEIGFQEVVLIAEREA